MLWARFVLSDGDGSLYEVRNRENQRKRVLVDHDGAARFQYPWADDPFPLAEALVAVQKHIDDEHERFVVWAASRPSLGLEPRRPRRIFAAESSDA